MGGGEGRKLFIRERNALHFYDGGEVRLRVRALRGLSLRVTRNRMVEGANIYRVNIPR